METDSSFTVADATPNDGGEEISLIEIVNLLLRNRRMIVIVPMLFAGLIGLITFTQDRTYIASASFIPQVSEGRSGAAALARQFGVNLGGGERAGGSPQFYADLLATRDVLRKAVEAEYSVKNSLVGERQGTLIDFYEIRGTDFTPAWQQGVERLRRDITISVGRETGIIQVTASAGSPELSEQIVSRLLQLVNSFNLESRQTQAQEEARFISGRMDEVHKEFLNAKARLQVFLQNNRQFQNSPELSFTHDDLQREVAMRQGIYTTLAQAREQARIDAVRDTPLLTLINSPEGSSVPEGKGTVKKTILAFFVALMLSIIAAFVLELGRRSQRGGQYEEFQQLVREVRKDLRSPIRWFWPLFKKNNNPNADPKAE